MGWFRVADRRLVYRGRLSRAPFDAWTASTEGADAIDAAAHAMRLRVFGRTRAKRRIWRDLDATARTEPIRDAIQAEADRFPSVMAALAYAESLPRVQVGLQRLVIVPRSLIAGRARVGLRRRLCPLLAGFDDAVVTFVCEQVLTEMDRAIEQTRPSPSRPFRAREEWSCVGGDRQYLWVDPLWSGASWSGHVLMYELPPAGLASRARKELERAIQGLQKAVTGLSRPEREAVVRMAAHT